MNLNPKTNKKPTRKKSSERGQVGVPRCNRIHEWTSFGRTIKQQCRKKATNAGLCKSCTREDS